MKTRFNTYDIVCSVTELQKYIGMRVNNIYDVDNRTYLFRLQKTEEKAVLLLESGNRFHITNYEWPKNVAPSGFSMKLRKHLKNKRLESVMQMGTDRIVNFQFGTGEAAYHVILELYDRGNILLCDHEMTILYVLRAHIEGENVKFAIREKYPQDRARESSAPSIEDIKMFLEGAKKEDNLKRVLMPKLEYGPSLIEHVLMKHGLNNIKIKDFNIDADIEKLHVALNEAETIMMQAKVAHSKGYIIQKKEERPNPNTEAEKEYFYSNQEFHPILYEQNAKQPHQEYESFNQAVDEFFSTLQAQKIDMKSMQQERDAIKKLENVKKDHVQRLKTLEATQENDKIKAELITKNQQLVDNAIVAIQSALASQISWTDIEAMVKEAAAKGDPVAKYIKQLKLNTNHFTILLADPYHEEDTPPQLIPVDIDLALTAFANARRFYDQKRSAAKKQQKTIESSSKALKSAEKRTKQALKEMQTTTNINKARKVYWFEKFFWFISSENYMVIAGRDQQQNELIVKRYMKPNDVYVHADIHGASSVVIKNPSGKPIPPKTLNEAGTMAICYSVAWDAKVLSNAYWVFGEQVSKTAPTGEYLTTGSFMIRGKKNFLPPSQLILGMGFLFKLEDGSVERHAGERKVLSATEEMEQLMVVAEDGKDEEEIVVSEGDDDEEDEKVQEVVEKEDINQMENIPEETPENLDETTQGNDNKTTDKDESNDEEDKGDNDSEDSSEEDSKFPDTQIKIKHFQGTTKIDIDSKPSILDEHQENSDNMELARQRSRTSSEVSTKSKASTTTTNSTKEAKQKQAPPKRGQKSKLKKIKEKYKDQDDEERELRMTILQSAGPLKKNNKKYQKLTQAAAAQARKQQAQQPRAGRMASQDAGQPHDDDEPVVAADVDMIDALTGLPVVEDELLFAVPVVAPYNTLAQYKFKVKLTPGTSKRGKAAKTAVNMFLHDKTTTQREKDLLKAVKDEAMARNIPGKVKLSAPRMQTLRK